MFFLLMWNKNIEAVCLNTSSKCLYNKELHDKATTFYYNFDNVISILSIIILTITGTTSVATISLNDDLAIKIIISIILYIIAVIDGIKKFTNPAQKHILHINAAKSYSNLHHNIQKQLVLESSQRQNAKDYIGWITRELDNLDNSTPDIPTFISNKHTAPEDIPLHEIVSQNVSPETPLESDSSPIPLEPSMEEVKDAYIFNRFKNLHTT